MERKISELDRFGDAFSELVTKEGDESKRVFHKMVVKYAEIMQDLFVNLGILARAQTAINMKVDGLTKIILEFPEVKNNPGIQKRITEVFKQYDNALERRIRGIMIFGHHFKKMYGRICGNNYRFSFGMKKG